METEGGLCKDHQTTQAKEILQPQEYDEITITEFQK